MVYISVVSINFLYNNLLYMSIIGELYARAFLRNGEPHPVEPVIDSSRLILFLAGVKAKLLDRKC